MPSFFSSSSSSSENRSKLISSEKTKSFYSRAHSQLFSIHDVIVFSHLRWDFVFQRPQHLMSRIATNHRVFFFEEPIFHSGPAACDIHEIQPKLFRVVPKLPSQESQAAVFEKLEQCVLNLLFEKEISHYFCWYYTPMALPFTKRLKPVISVYDCMDELTGFKGAPESLKYLEKELFKRVDVVFTGGRALFESKKDAHRNVHLFPSSVDFRHFAKARIEKADPSDQVQIARPRIGYSGVIDERMDVSLLNSIASKRPHWQFIILGPIIKIDPTTLPRLPNVHYLGLKKYEELPSYLGGWDVTMLPFAHNEATRFISPTKTPEYLAAGKPVVSTSIRDVVRPYERLGFVKIADSPEDFIQAIEEALKLPFDSEMVRKIDAYLSKNSWDVTSRFMQDLLHESFESKMASPGLS